MTADRSRPTETARTPRDEACDWMALRRSAEMTVHDEREFRVWLQADPANRLAYEDLEDAWGFLDNLRGDPELMALREQSERASGGGRHLRLAAAVVAGVAVAAAAGWAVLRPGQLPVAPWAAAAPVEEHRTGVGQRSTLKLADGSVVTLDTSSILRTHAFGARRVVELVQGRAYFQVAKDRTRPFVVNVDGKTVTAVGTAFDVQVDPQGLEVTLAEGRVQVEEPHDGFRRGQLADLTAGTRLQAPFDGRWRAQKVDVARETSWLQGRLTFDAEPLVEAAEAMNRYSEKKLVIRDPSIARTPVVGVFRAGDVEGFARAAQLYGLAQVGADEPRYVELRAFPK